MWQNRSSARWPRRRTRGRSRSTSRRAARAGVAGARAASGWQRGSCRCTAKDGQQAQQVPVGSAGSYGKSPMFGPGNGPRFPRKYRDTRKYQAQAPVGWLVGTQPYTAAEAELSKSLDRTGTSFTGSASTGSYLEQHMAGSHGAHHEHPSHELTARERICAAQVLPVPRQGAEGAQAAGSGAVAGDEHAVPVLVALYARLVQQEDVLGVQAALRWRMPRATTGMGWSACSGSTRMGWRRSSARRSLRTSRR
ncbi:hypothetical protein DL89DRAFT_5258 [Linderina pennispora]|uniref:Uncharacterized protein n=1 Tax=Linderina pennispora TaxID=61395 RepID=A0A1Y1WKF8_9FUNG|nr:uncharacterized protein DL89DRAFT_5258 [Linderina pennispora]ORX73865.1 hypothetical protein DL89DRAFT_5258 [Linderina pennispora]